MKTIKQQCNNITEMYIVDGVSLISDHQSYFKMPVFDASVLYFNVFISIT